MEQIEIKQVVTELKDLFGIEKSNVFSYESDNVFNIGKTQFERMEVLGMLQKYFSDKVINGGYLKVDNITFIHTTFRVLEGHPS